MDHVLKRATLMPLILNRCPFVAKKETSARAGEEGAGKEIAEERACMRVIVDRLRAVPLFLQLVR